MENSSHFSYFLLYKKKSIVCCMYPYVYVIQSLAESVTIRHTYSTRNFVNRHCRLSVVNGSLIPFIYVKRVSVVGFRSLLSSKLSVIRKCKWLIVMFRISVQVSHNCRSSLSFFIVGCWLSHAAGCRASVDDCCCRLSIIGAQLWLYIFHMMKLPCDC